MAEPDESQVPAAGAVISVDLKCRACDYNLRTLSAAGRCPECGRPVADSVFIIPEPERAACDVQGAGIGLIGCFEVGVVLLAIILAGAARDLHFRCALGQVAGVAGATRWLWRAAIWRLVAIFLVFAVVGFGDPATPGFGCVSSFGGESRATLGGYALSYNVIASGGATRSYQPRGVAGDVKVRMDEPGVTVIEMYNPVGWRLSSDDLAPGQTIELKDADGRPVRVTLERNGVLVVTNADGGTTKDRWFALRRVPDRATMGAATEVCLMCLLIAAEALQLCAVVCYLSVCSGLAAAVGRRDLKWAFWIILPLFAAGTLVIGLVAPLTTLLEWELTGPGPGSRLAMSVFDGWRAVAALGTFVVFVGFLLALYKLNEPLKRAVRSWDEITEVLTK